MKMKTCTCLSCKEEKPATNEFFHTSGLLRIKRTGHGNMKCKVCASKYALEYRTKRKEKRANQEKSTLSKIIGTIYVIGPSDYKTPFKIGYTTGYNINKRRHAIQTAHWLDIKEIWKSDMIEDIFSIEKKLHKHFAAKRVRGEWYKINKQDIASIPMLVKSFIQESAA